MVNLEWKQLGKLDQEEEASGQCQTHPGIECD